MHAIGVENDSPTWAEEKEAELALYRLEGRWRALESEWIALDAADGHDIDSQHGAVMGSGIGYLRETGEIIDKVDLLLGLGDPVSVATSLLGGVEPLIRWCQNEAHRAEIHSTLARRYRQVADRLEQRARAAKLRGGRLRQLLARYLRILGRQRLSTGGVAYVRDRPQLVIDQAIADTIPDEWFRIKRTLQQRLILRAHAKGEPIPLACAVVDVPMVVIRD